MILVGMTLQPPLSSSSVRFGGGLGHRGGGQTVVIGVGGVGRPCDVVLTLSLDFLLASGREEVWETLVG